MAKAITGFLFLVSFWRELLDKQWPAVCALNLRVSDAAHLDSPHHDDLGILVTARGTELVPIPVSGLGEHMVFREKA